jgi:hypothetical protein
MKMTEQVYGGLSVLVILVGVVFWTGAAEGGALDRSGTQWAPFIEWSLENPSYTGNPFDVVATVTFIHSPSGERRTTEMFYAGGITWKFRFTGTRLGAWTFTTASSDAELHGHSGTVMMHRHASPHIQGFLTSQGNKFAMQVGEQGTLRAYRLNVYMNRVDYEVFAQPAGLNGDWTKHPLFNFNNPAHLQAYLQDARHTGFDTVFAHPGYPFVWTDGNNPRFALFEMLEKMITTAHSQGMQVHIWAWADARRGGTPPGGINSPQDRRLQRYIAARLGPLPGWSMGYGFDLREWVTEAQTQAWVEFMQQKMGWPHLLWARDRYNPALSAKSYPGYTLRSYAQIVSDMSSDPLRPHLYEERHTYKRSSELDMTGTRRFLWHLTMAGGAGGFWGYFPDKPHPYPNPEQLRTAKQFWEKRFLLDMVPANTSTDGVGLHTPDNRHYVFYKTDASVVWMDLSKMAGSQPGKAVDTKLPYAEIDLGMLSAAKRTWTAPYPSDWAIAVGTFGEADTIPGTDSLPPAPPTGMVGKPMP